MNSVRIGHAVESSGPIFSHQWHLCLTHFLLTCFHFLYMLTHKGVGEVMETIQYGSPYFFSCKGLDGKYLDIAGFRFLAIVTLS